MLFKGSAEELLKGQKNDELKFYPLHGRHVITNHVQSILNMLKNAWESDSLVFHSSQFESVKSAMNFVLPYFKELSYDEYQNYVLVFSESFGVCMHVNYTHHLYGEPEVEIELVGMIASNTTSHVKAKGYIETLRLIEEKVDSCWI